MDDRGSSGHIHVHFVHVCLGLDIDAAGIKRDSLARKYERLLIFGTLEIFENNKFWFFKRTCGNDKHCAHAKAFHCRFI